MTDLQKRQIHELKRLLIAKLPQVLNYLLPNGKIKNNKFFVGDVSGNPGESLAVELKGEKIGMWHDFAQNLGGDILGLWANAKGIDIKTSFPAVLSSVKKWLGIEEQTIYPHEYNNLNPSQKWEYLDESGKPLVIVYRYDTENGKEFRPYDVIAKKYQAPEIRPLYNLPGIKESKTVVIVEGEKAAQALIDMGICATTAMNGANAPLDKTDFSVLVNKEIIIWPDNDDVGEQFGKKLSEKLSKERVDSIYKILIPECKPNKWDAADAVKDGTNISALLAKKLLIELMIEPLYDFEFALNKKTPPARDIIFPRVLTPRGAMLFGGVPKIGKSDFMLNWLTHMAAGEEFMGMTPQKPLKIIYLQAEIELDYMCERIQEMNIDDEIKRKSVKNFFFSSAMEVVLNGKGIKVIQRSISRFCPDGDVDIIVIDPIRNFFDSQNNTGSENDNTFMMEFLKQKIISVRNHVNPNAGVILIHHFRKLNSMSIKEEMFNAFAGAGSLRSFYTTGILMWQPDESRSECRLDFELRYGAKIPTKWIDRIDGKWVEIDKLEENKEYVEDIILNLIAKEALEGRVYTQNQFREKFDGYSNIGKDKMRYTIEELADAQDIRFFRNGEIYGLPNPTRTKFGYMCLNNMKLKVKIHDNSGKEMFRYEIVKPTHFKSKIHGEILPVISIESNMIN